VLAERYARTRLPILVVGATGTGKEVLAQHIHERRGRPGMLVDVNCGAPLHRRNSLIYRCRQASAPARRVPWNWSLYPSVIYRYLVGGREYHGCHLGYRGGWFTFWGDNPWTAGQSVHVSYDTASPSHSVLRPGVGLANYLGAALGVVSLMLATTWLIYVARAA
jgi:hypothetical protein